MNTATVEELDVVPGLGPVKARAIVDWRTAHGPCASLDELTEVPGIGAATLAAMQGRARCGPTDAVGPVAPPPAPEDRPALAATPRTVDVNTATVEELLQLPGMVEARAQAIVDDRERGGPFASCSDLVRVEGIGPATVSAFGDRCTTQ